MIYLISYSSIVKRREELASMGYTVEADQYGYTARLNGDFIYGASVKGRPKMHWRHAQANNTDNHEHGWRECERHCAQIERAQ